MDRRHIRRQKIVQDLFASTYHDDTPQREVVLRILAEKAHLDELISAYAQKYAIEDIARVDIAIMRLAIFELLYEQKAPPRVIINEAVELAKEMGGEKSPGFINAILGKVFEEHYEKHNEEPA